MKNQTVFDESKALNEIKEYQKKYRRDAVMPDGKGGYRCTVWIWNEAEDTRENCAQLFTDKPSFLKHFSNAHTGNNKHHFCKLCPGEEAYSGASGLWYHMKNFHGDKTKSYKKKTASCKKRTRKPRKVQHDNKSIAKHKKCRKTKPNKKATTSNTLVHTIPPENTIPSLLKPDDLVILEKLDLGASEVGVLSWEVLNSEPSETIAVSLGELKLELSEAGALNQDRLNVDALKNGKLDGSDYFQKAHGVSQEPLSSNCNPNNFFHHYADLDKKETNAVQKKR